MAEHIVISALGIRARASWARWFWGLGMVACVAVATGASAADHAGKASFDQYCASCHGTAGDGKGPVAAEMKTPPTDLRKLGKKYGKPLPKPKLLEVIDGREMVRSHGTTAMPVWGEQLVHNVPPTVNTEFFKRGAIIVIVNYIETLQLE